MLRILDADGPLVVFLHGIPGSGKSTLLEVFIQSAGAANSAVIRLDCSGIEPTPAGLISALAIAAGLETLKTPKEIAITLGRAGLRVVVILDNYEVFSLMDSWLRQVLIPLLPDNVRVVLSGREEPAMAWFSAPGWRRLFKAIQLDCLDQSSALEYLSRASVPADEAKRLEGVCRGLPLALALAASLPGRGRNMALSARIAQILKEISELCLSEAADPQTRQVLEAASVVRRITIPLLRAMRPDVSPRDVLERIRALPFVQADKRGLRIHDAVRDAVALTLRAQDPQQYYTYKTAACRHLMSELRTAAASDLWECTTDLLYVLANKAVREAFFPTGAQEYAVEPAQSEDGPEILRIISRHEGPDMGKWLEVWWCRAPETFMVARDRRDAVVGFYCAFDPHQYARLGIDDPVVCAWTDHLQEKPLQPQQCAFFLRRWLAAETGEAPSAVQAACWIDVTRKYLDQRPNFGRVYLTFRNLGPYAAVVKKLGGEVLPERSVLADASPYSTAMLDYGSSSVDGWLARLAASESSAENDGPLDCAARELVLDGHRTTLTKLEFRVMEYLTQHRGQAVSRAAFLENVWEQVYDGGSNVVDVVIRALRKKLGDRAAMIETVQRVGYRLRREE